MREYDEPEAEPIRPEDFLLPHGLSPDARRLGLDRNTEEGAMLAMTGSLNPAKTSHKLVAWVLLLAFAAPLLLGITRQLF